MLRAYIDGVSQSVNNRSALSFTITDLKGNLEYQFYELLDCKRSNTEIEMMAFNKIIDWLLENKIKEIVIYTESRFVYTNWRTKKSVSAK